MIINWREYLPAYKGDIFEFARLLGCQEEIEESIRIDEQKLNQKIQNKEEFMTVGSITIRLKELHSPVLDRLTKQRIESLKSKLERLEEFKVMEDISYSQKSDEHKIRKIIQDFIETNGEYSEYRVNFYSNYIYIRELDKDSLHIWIDDYNDEDGNHYLATYVSLFCTSKEIDNYNEDRCDIKIGDGDIVYNEDCLILMTKEYDLSIEVKERKPNPETRLDNVCVEDISIDDILMIGPSNKITKIN